VIASQLVAHIDAKSSHQYTNSHNINEWLEDLNQLDFEVNGNKISIELKHSYALNKDNNDFQSLGYKGIQKYGLDNKLSFNSGMMLHGDAGTGKSGVLNYVTAWAHSKNWVVMKVRNCFHITHPKELLGKDEEISMHPVEKHLESRLFLDYVNSGRVLKDFMTANEEILRQIPVNRSLYGKMNIVGVHDNEPVPVPNAYNAWRKFNFYDSDKFMLDFEIEELGERNRKFKTRLGEALPDPET